MASESVTIMIAFCVGHKGDKKRNAFPSSQRKDLVTVSERNREGERLTSSRSSSGVAGVRSVLNEAMDDVSESMESSS